MKRHNKIIGIIAALIATGCTGITEPETPAENIDSAEETGMTITVGLPGGETDTRLDFAEADFEGRRAIRTYWEKGDIIIANADPSTSNHAYSFNLTEGEGTSTGTFKCNAGSPQSLTSNAWTIYLPGSSVKCEADYLNHTYTGQVQKGNGNMDHLKDFHTLRMRCTDLATSIRFNESYIELSGENLDESSCLKFILNGLPETTPAEIAVS